MRRMAPKTTFGEYVRSLRLSKSIGQRQLARLLKISPSYLNDIERNKRDAPRSDLVRAIGGILKADTVKLYDLAGLSRDDIALDVAEIVQSSPETVALLRAIHEYKPSEKTIREIREKIMASGTSAIIIAAGMGTRMEGLTEDKPKCMVEFGNKTLLQRQLEAYRGCGITDISVVRGYLKDKINYDGLRYFENSDYENNNILNSLFYAEKAITGHVICAYSDILFDAHVVERALESQHDMSVVVDIDWRGYYDGRRDHPLSEAENIIFDADNKVISAGKIMADKNDVHGEFIGMIKLSPRGTEIFKRHFHRVKELYAGKPFQRAKVFEKAYLTDIIQDMADMGVPIHCVIIERGWKEIDTIEDYEKALIDLES